MHVNEQTLGSTRRALRDAGFTDLRVWAGDWVHHGIIPSALARRISFRLARTPGLRQFGAGNIFATARAPLTGRESAPSAT
jgi:hypothetical protein